MKKLLLLGAMMVAMVSCGGKATDKAAAAVDTKDASGTIRFATWTGNPEEDKALKMMIAEFEKANPKIKVEYAPLTGDYNQVLTTQMSGGQGPDVFYYDAYTAGQYIEDDYLEPIEGYDLTDFYPAMVAPFVKNGKTYGIPKDFSTLALYYNKDMFTKAGLPEPKDKMTWEEFVDLSKKLTKGDVVGFGGNFDLARLKYAAEATGSKIETADGKPNFTDPEVIKAIKQFIDMHTAKTLVTAEEKGAGWAGDLLGTGKVAMVMEGPWIQPFLAQNFKDLKYGVVEMPLTAGKPATAAYTVSLGINADSKNKVAARAFIDFMTSAQGMEKWSASYKVLPTRKSLVTKMGLAADPLLKAHVAGAEYANLWAGSPNLRTIYLNFGKTMPLILQGKVTLEEGLKQITEAK